MSTNIYLFFFFYILLIILKLDYPRLSLPITFNAIKKTTDKLV